MSRSAQKRTHLTFDVPIDFDDDSDSVEEDKSVSLQGYYGQEDKISKDIPLDDCTAHTCSAREAERETPERRILPQHGLS